MPTFTHTFFMLPNTNFLYYTDWTVISDLDCNQCHLDCNQCHSLLCIYFECKFQAESFMYLMFKLTIFTVVVRNKLYYY